MVTVPLVDNIFPRRMRRTPCFRNALGDSRVGGSGGCAEVKRMRCGRRVNGVLKEAELWCTSAVPVES